MTEQNLPLNYLSLLAVVALSAAGGGGFSATKSISPWDVFRPGLMSNRHQPDVR